MQDHQPDPPWPYIPPDAFETKDPVPYPPEHGEALLADALVAGWPLPRGMTAPDQWALGAPVVPGVSQLSLPCEMAAEASLVLHQAQTQAFDRAHQSTHRKHFSIPDVLITPDPDEGGEAIAELTIEPERRRSMVFSQYSSTDQSAFDAPSTPPQSKTGDDFQELHWAHIAALAHGPRTLAGICQSSDDLPERPRSIPPTAFDSDWDSSSEEQEDDDHEEENWIARHPNQASSTPTQAFQASEREQRHSPSAPLTDPSSELPILIPKGSAGTLGQGVPVVGSVAGMTGAAAGAAVFASWAATEEQSHSSRSPSSDMGEHPLYGQLTQSNTDWAPPAKQEIQPAMSAVDDLTLVPSRRAPAPPPSPLTESDAPAENSVDIEADPVPRLEEEPLVQHELNPIAAQPPTLLEPADLPRVISQPRPTESEHPTISAPSAPEPIESASQPSHRYRSSSPGMPDHSVTTSVSSLTDVWATPRSSPLASPNRSPIQSSFEPGHIHEPVPKLELERSNSELQAQLVQQDVDVEQQSTTDVRPSEEDQLPQQTQTEARDLQVATGGSTPDEAFEPSTPRPEGAAPRSECENQAPQVELAVVQNKPKATLDVSSHFESQAEELEIPVEPRARVVDAPAQPKEPQEDPINAELDGVMPSLISHQFTVPVFAAQQSEAPVTRSTPTPHPTSSPAAVAAPNASTAPSQKPAPEATAPVAAQASAPTLSAPITRPRRSSWSSWFGLRRKDAPTHNAKHVAKHGKFEPKYDPKFQLPIPCIPPTTKAPSHLTNKTTEVDRTGPAPTLPALNVGSDLTDSPSKGLLGSLSFSSTSLAGSTTHLPPADSSLGAGAASISGLDSSIATQPSQLPPVTARSGSPRPRFSDIPPRAQYNGASGAAAKENHVYEAEDSDAVRLSYTVPDIELDFPWLVSVPTGGSPTPSSSINMTPTVSHESIVSELLAENPMCSEVPTEGSAEVYGQTGKVSSKPVTALSMELNHSEQGTVGQVDSHSVAATVESDPSPYVKVRPAAPELNAVAPKTNPVGAGARDQVTVHTALVDDSVPSTAAHTTDPKPLPPAQPQQAAPKPLNRWEAKIAAKQVAKTERAKAKAETALLKELQKVDRLVRQHDAKMAKGQAKQAQQRDKSSKSSVPSSPINEIATKLGWEPKLIKTEHSNEKRRGTLRKLLKLGKSKEVPAERSAKSGAEPQSTPSNVPPTAPGSQPATSARQTPSRPKSRPTSQTNQNGRRVSSLNGRSAFVARTSSTRSRATVRGRLHARTASRTQGLGTNLALSAPLNPTDSDDEGWINTDPSDEVDVSGVSSSDAMTSLAGSIDATALNQARRGRPLSTAARSSLPYAPIIKGFDMPDPTSLPMASHLGSGSGSAGNASESPVESSGSQAGSRQSTATTISSPPLSHGDTHPK